MPPLLFVLFLAALAVVWLLLLQRRSELGRMQRTVQERREAHKRGTHAALLQYPQIDLSRCLGCGACITACPEQGVLDMLHGQALVVHGASCIGHGHCETACPASAIRLGWLDLEQRRDLPVLSKELEAPDAPGLFLAGEVTGRGLIRHAIEQGVAVARTLEQRFATGEQPSAPTSAFRSYDLIVVGAGPAGLSCAIEAKQRGLDVLLLEQGRFGGTIAHFPREKLVLTQAVQLPGYGTLEAASYQRDELLAIWKRAVAGTQLALREEVSYEGSERAEDGSWRVFAAGEVLHTRAVCLALGRRGNPNRLQVPGEELSKVRYGLLEARALRARRILVVGGGDSAAETALALVRQSSNKVTLAHRGAEFQRMAVRQRLALEAAEESGRLRVLRRTTVTSIGEHQVHLLKEGRERVRLTNDDVFILIGAQPAVPLLESSGVCFDPQQRMQMHVAAAQAVEQDERRRLLLSLGWAIALGLALAGFVVWNWDYYGLDLDRRPLSAQHSSLRPSGTLGLAFGWFGIALFVANLGYLLKRLRAFPFGLGLPRHWLSVHITTGLFLLPIALLHGGLHLGDTTGGHGLVALVLLVLTGALGRFIYSYLPRAVSGRDLEFEETSRELHSIQLELAEIDQPLAQRVESMADTMISAVRWRGGILARVWGLLRSPLRFRRATVSLVSEAQELGLSETQIQHVVYLLGRAERASRLAAHYDDLRALLAGWRHVHMWVAALFLLLLLRHVWDAWQFGVLWPW